MTSFPFQTDYKRNTSDESGTKGTVEPMSYLRFVVKVSVWTFALVAFVYAGRTTYLIVTDIKKKGNQYALVEILMTCVVSLICFVIVVLVIHQTVRLIVYGQDEMLRVFSWFVALIILVATVFWIGAFVHYIYKKGHPRDLAIMNLSYFVFP